MKKYHLYFTLLLFGCVSFLSGCKDSIDLLDIDTSSSVNAGVASPIGTIKVAVSDIMLHSVSPNFYINQDGVVAYRDTSHFSLSFQDLDWTKYAYKTSKVFEMPDIPGFIPDISLPFDLELPLEFDFALELKDLNLNPEEERFDSILLDYILLSSKINQRDMNLDWKWVDSVIINLGPQCYRAAGHNYVVYRKDDDRFPEYGFGKSIPSNVDNFSICLMKDRTLKPGINTLEEFNTNVVDTVKMQLGFYVTVPRDTKLTIGSNAAILYDLDFQGLQPQALWGYFKPAESMSIEDSIDIISGWHIGEMLNEMRLPFARPEIIFNITTQIAANWEISTKGLYTTNEKGEKGWAMFNGQHSWKKSFPSLIDLNPSTLGDSATYSFTFNETDSLGHIDNLFSISPSRLVYQFGLDFMDPQRYPQVRIPKQTKIDVDMLVDMPLEFNPGVLFTYADTLRDLDFEGLTVDSAQLPKTEIFLVLNAYNEMPITVVGDLRFLDKNGTDLNILAKPLQFAAKDSSKQVIEFHEKDINKLSATKSILVKLNANDEVLREKTELYPIQITKEELLTIQLGFVGNAEIRLNF